MQSLELISWFYVRIKEDNRIGPTHIAIYMALFEQWHLQGFEHPLCITKYKIMPMAKVYSRHTYNQCLHQLHEYGYIKYVPSPNPLLESLVYLHHPKMIKSESNNIEGMRHET